jgi:hypothetical protein
MRRRLRDRVPFHQPFKAFQIYLPFDPCQNGSALFTNSRIGIRVRATRGVWQAPRAFRAFLPWKNRRSKTCGTWLRPCLLCHHRS